MNGDRASGPFIYEGLKQLGALLLSLALWTATAGKVSAEDQASFCTAYTNDATTQAQIVQNNPLCAARFANDPSFTTNSASHFGWCMAADRSASIQSMQDRQSVARRCEVCQQYADAAVAQNVSLVGSIANVPFGNLPSACRVDLSSPRFSTDPNVHFNWCMDAQTVFTASDGLTDISIDDKILEANERKRARDGCQEALATQSTQQPLSSAGAPNIVIENPKKQSGSSTTAIIPAKPGTSTPGEGASRTKLSVPIKPVDATPQKGASKTSVSLPEKDEPRKKPAAEKRVKKEAPCLKCDENGKAKKSGAHPGDPIKPTSRTSSVTAKPPSAGLLDDDEGGGGGNRPSAHGPSRRWNR